jgi:hypothetical protein
MQGSLPRQQNGTETAMTAPGRNDQPGDDSGPTVISGERARQGRIVLTRPWQRAVFVAGLVVAVLLAIVWPLIA